MFKSKLPNLGVSIFSQMSALANQHNAINLSQGFPEFDAPDFLKNSVTKFIAEGMNQYSPSSGVASLQTQIAELVARKYQRTIEPSAEVTVTSGATEALYVAIQTLVKDGDEVIVFDPAYDSYEPAIELAGGKAIHVQLHAPDYQINWDYVAGIVNQRTVAIIVNTPHNPTGTMLLQHDIDALTKLVTQHDLYVISDEVYEHITFDEKPHLSILRFEQLADRAFVISSFGKTFHATGWKLGYCVAPAELSCEFRKIHQYVTFSSFTPAQLGIAQMMAHAPEHIDELGAFYQAKRDLLISALAPSRFALLPSAGTYFLLLDYSAISDMKDVDFCHYLTIEHGVAAIPLSVFNQSGECNKVIRLCFAKNDDTLLRAAERLCKL